MIYLFLFSSKHTIQYDYCMRNIITYYCHIISNSAPRLLLQCAVQLRLEGREYIGTTIYGDQPLYRNVTFLLVEGRLPVRLSPWPHTGHCAKRSLPRRLFHHRASLANSGTTPAPISLPCRPFQFPWWKTLMKRKSEVNSTFPKYEYLSKLCNRLEYLTPE